MKYCNDCRTPVRDYMEYCPKCGNNMSTNHNRSKGWLESLFLFDMKVKKS